MAGSRGAVGYKARGQAKCFFEFSHGGSGQPACLLAYALGRDRGLGEAGCATDAHVPHVNIRGWWENLRLLCPFHHLIAVHRWGWQLLLNPDGTTTAVSPDRKRTYHSHAPPTAA
jgi:hypothetical protein